MLEYPTTAPHRLASLTDARTWADQILCGGDYPPGAQDRLAEYLWLHYEPGMDLSIHPVYSLRHADFWDVVDPQVTP